MKNKTHITHITHITRLAALVALLATQLLSSRSIQAGPRRPKGVTAEIEKAITRGVDFLVRTQNPNGSWNNMGGWGKYPSAMTAIVGTALITTGSTSTQGPYSPAIRKAADFLLKVARPNGLIATQQESGRSMHGHGFAMLFLAEIYGNEEDIRRQRFIHDVLTRAVRITERSQSRAGGWLYTPEQDADEGSVTITQIQGMRGCRNAGIFVNPSTIVRAIKYIERSANPDGGLRYSLMSNGGGSRPAITAAAVATLYNAGEYDSPLAMKCLSYCDRNLSVDSGSGSAWGHYFYTHLYLAQVKYHQGGKHWEQYYQAISRRLLNMQKADGAWMGDGVGTSYGTAVALIILNMPYQYVSIYQR
jgi:ribosomal protein L17